MRTIKLEASDGEILKGRLPENWAEVPLAPYALLAGTTTVPARIEALAALVGLPAQPLLDNVSLFGVIAEAAPWLLRELPPTGEPVDFFHHAGQRWVSQGPLRKLTAGQLEGLYTMQAAYEGRPLEATPGILAILYVPAGQALTPEAHQVNTAALATLPMDIAYPAIISFTRSGAFSASTHIRTSSALTTQIRQGLSDLEAALLTAKPSGNFCWRLLRFLVRHWLRNARKTV